MINYKCIGKDGAPVIVFSHSLGANMDFWYPQVQKLEKEFHILLYDHRGHGDSDSPRGKWEIKDFGNDILNLLDKLELDRTHFCGLSLGGMVGLWLASNASNRIERLIIANTASKIKDTALLQNRIKEIKTKGLLSVSEDITKGWFSTNYMGDTKKVEHKLLKTSDKAYIQTAQAVCKFDLRSDLNKIGNPTLVITGSMDQVTPPNWGRQIADSIPSSSHIELKAAHMSNLEAPNEFNHAIKNWLSI